MDSEVKTLPLLSGVAKPLGCDSRVAEPPLPPPGESPLNRREEWATDGETEAPGDPA